MQILRAAVQPQRQAQPRGAAGAVEAAEAAVHLLPVRVASAEAGVVEEQLHLVWAPLKAAAAEEAHRHGPAWEVEAVAEAVPSRSACRTKALVVAVAVGGQPSPASLVEAGRARKTPSTAAAAALPCACFWVPEAVRACAAPWPSRCRPVALHSPG